MNFRTILLTMALAVTLWADDSVTHIVFCWMDSSISDSSIELLMEETRELIHIPGIESIEVGRPIPSERPIVDDSFTFGITMKFASEDAMNAYLSDERHTSFVGSKIKPVLTKIQVYDIH